MEYNISSWNLPNSFSDCIQMAISNVSYPTFIDPEYRCGKDSCSDSGNVLECWSFLLSPVDYLRRYFDKTPKSPKSKADCNSRVLVRRMDFTNASWFHDIPKEKRGDKMYQCKEHFRRKMNQCDSNNVGGIAAFAGPAVILCSLLLYRFCQKSDEVSPGYTLALVWFMLTVVFFVILLVVTVDKFCTRLVVDVGWLILVSVLASAFSTFIGLLLMLLCVKFCKTARGSSGVAQNTQHSNNGNIPSPGRTSESTECETTPQASSKDIPPSYNQATLPSYSEATEMQCEKF